jgi:hypothetical protein
VTRVIVQYTVKPDQAARNEELIRAVYDELSMTKPAGLRYATIRLDDGVTFIHIADQDTDGPSPVVGLSSFQRFQDGIGDRCDQPPVARQVRLIGSFRMFQEDEAL